MEAFHLSSKIVENGKEFLIQTVNEVGVGQIKTSIFENGELLDTNVVPHSEDAGETEINNLLKIAHKEKKAEMEYLFSSYKSIIDSGEPQMMFHLGTSLFYKKLYFEAQQLFRTAIKLNENYHEAYVFLAKTNMALDHFQDAIDSAAKAVEMKPQYPDYRNVLGEAYLGAESCKRAFVEFEKAISYNVYYADAYLNLALANILNGINHENYELSADMTTKCSDFLKKAALIYPEYQSELYNKGMSYLSSGDIKMAFKIFWDIREEKKENNRQQKASHYNRFLIYTDWLSEDSIAERIRTLESELNRNPDYVDLYYDLSICCMQQSKLIWKKGNSYLQKTLEIKPKLKKAQRALNIARDEYVRIAESISNITDGDKG